jgi:hypothetical protein
LVVLVVVVLALQFTVPLVVTMHAAFASGGMTTKATKVAANKAVSCIGAVAIKVAP